MATNISLGEVIDRFRWAPPAERAEIIEELLEPSKESVVPELRRRLFSKDRDAVCIAAEILLRIDRDESLAPTLELLESPDGDMRDFICLLLTFYPNDRAAPQLAAFIRRETDDCIRYRAIEALGCCGAAQEIPFLEYLAANDDGTDFEGRPNREMARQSLEYVRWKMRSDQ